MEYDGSKLKVKIDKKDDRYAFQVLEMPEEWRGVNRGDFDDNNCIFKTSNGWRIRSFSHPAINVDNFTIYLRGDGGSDSSIFFFDPYCLDDIVTALREFGAIILGDAVCDDHEWVTVYKGDPTYEGTLCKKCLIKQS